MKLLWQQIGSTAITDILSESDMDGVVLDLEHGVFNNETICDCIRIINLKGKKSFVRLKNVTDTGLFGMVLDANVGGIILSTVDSLSQAMCFSRMCNYPKNHGIRGQGLVRENWWGEKPFEFRKPIMVAQIESKNGVENLQNLYNSYENDIDYYLIGPYDLSASLGHPGDFNNQKYKNAISKIEETVPSEKIGYHIVKGIEVLYAEYKKYGLLAFGLDTLMLIDGTKRIKEAIK